MQTNEEIRKEWEEDFDEKFDLWFNDVDTEEYYNKAQIKLFIESLLSLQKQQMITALLEKGEGLKKYDIENTEFDEGSPSYNETHNRGYHKAITDYQNLIKE